MITQHTPAPWRIGTISEHHGEYEIFAGDSQEDAAPIIANIEGGLGAHESNCCESMANAQLIAAAPDLLQALEGLYCCGLKQGWDASYPSSFEAAEAAIKKALGEAA